MAYQDIFSYANQTGATGMTGIFGYVANQVPIFFPFLLFCIGCLILLGSYYAEKRQSYQGDFWSSFAVATVVTAVLSNILYWIPSPALVNGYFDAVFTVIGLVGIITMFWSNER